MLNIFKKKQSSFNYKPFKTNYINKEQNYNVQSKYAKDEYKNIRDYPSASKEWFSNIYSFNNLYLKSLIVYDTLLNKLLTSYCNMLQYKIKRIFKRRRHIYSRYSPNQIYVSRPELKHTNTKLMIILYTYNKKKSDIELFLINILIDIKILKGFYKKKFVNLSTKLKKYHLKKNLFLKQNIEKNKNKYVSIKNSNLVIFLLKNQFLVLKKWSTTFFKFKNNLLNYLVLNMSDPDDKIISTENIMFLRYFFELQALFFYYTKSINFNKSKFNNLVLNFRNYGLINLIQKIYGKKVEIKLVELKSIHLNSDVFSSAVALKLRDRKKNAVKILSKAVYNLVDLPYLHTLVTFDNEIESMDKNNVLNTIKQQVVSGVRFEASGRLTRRLTAMRAVFKYRYMGSLKNIRSSFNKKSSPILRGHLKANSQYTLINSKTRNGTFGLKGWVSSH